MGRLRDGRGKFLRTRLDGFDQMVGKMAKSPERFKRAVGAGMYAAANNVMTASLEIVPVDSGALKGSGYVTLPEESGSGELVVEMGYGGDAKEYAERQHEDTSLQHKDGGQAKYLQRPYMEKAGGILKTIAMNARAAFRANKGPSNSAIPKKPVPGRRLK